jgi:hypothetical protein
VVDAINRRVHEKHDATIIMYKYDLYDRILEVSKFDQRCVDIKENLQQGISQHNLKGYELR